MQSKYFVFFRPLRTNPSQLRVNAFADHKLDFFSLTRQNAKFHGVSLSFTPRPTIGNDEDRNKIIRQEVSPFDAAWVWSLASRLLSRD